MRNIKGIENSIVEKAINVDAVKRVVDLCFVIDPEVWDSAESEKGLGRELANFDSKSAGTDLHTTLFFTIIVLSSMGGKLHREGKIIVVIASCPMCEQTSESARTAFAHAIASSRR